ncbi:lyase family protein [Streptomyces sp. NPDC057638]|uniref:lyase family protein n=1 Tax=Streptomyces sp. NPDC057638 TaxID=3346190 RepID=UPI0036871553
MISSFQTVLVEKAEQHVETIFPGYTHLQRAHPVPRHTRGGVPSSVPGPAVGEFPKNHAKPSCVRGPHAYQ